MALPNDPKNPKDAEAFHRALDDHHPQRNDPAKVKAENAREARRLFNLIKAGRKK